jgi:segregation and condensation protein B
LLFASPEPQTASRLASLTGSPQRATREALTELAAQLQDGRGLRLSQSGDTYRLVTAPEASQLIEQLGQDASRAELTPAALETLAVVAYRGPITRAGIDQLRGVSSDSTLRGLIGRGFIIEAGRSAEPGKPLLYTTSHAFLEQFGLTSTADLPSPEEDEDHHAH